MSERELCQSCGKRKVAGGKGFEGRTAAKLSLCVTCYNCREVRQQRRVDLGFPPRGHMRKREGKQPTPKPSSRRPAAQKKTDGFGNLLLSNAEELVGSMETMTAGIQRLSKLIGRFSERVEGLFQQLKRGSEDFSARCNTVEDRLHHAEDELHRAAQELLGSVPQDTRDPWRKREE